MKQIVVQPKQPKVNVGFTLEVETAEFIEAEAERLGISKSHFVRAVIDQYREAIADAPAA